MARILINDGIEKVGEDLLKAAGHEVVTDKIDQKDLLQELQNFDAISVRSATEVRQELIDACPRLRAIGRGGVGMDNIDVAYAKSKDIAVINTPAASSRSVAELVFAHLYGIARFLPQSNREMPTKGSTEFGKLKKNYSKGFELQGKTLGVIGLGRIGQETAQLGLSNGMNVIGVDPYVESVELIIGGAQVSARYSLVSSTMDELLSTSDIISLHIPNVGKYVLSHDEFSKMKKGVILINCSRGGTVDEDAMLTALKDGTLAAAGLDVFENEPTPRQDILSHPRISLTPHTGASTEEAQEKIGIELAEKLIAALK